MLAPMRPFAVLLLLLTACSSPSSSQPAANPPASGTPATVKQSPAAAPSAVVATDTPVASATPIVTPTFVDISAPSATVVWLLVAGDHLFRSSDGGDSWEERRLPSGHWLGSAISFVNDREGWFLKTFVPGTACQQQGYELWHTNDAGASWARLGVDEPFFGPLAGQCKRTMTFADPMNGVVVALDPYTSPTIYRTADGGNSWSFTRLPDPPGYVNNGGGNALIPGPVRWLGLTLLVEGVAVVGEKQVHYVFRSSDAGASWSVVASVTDFYGMLGLTTASRWLQIALPAASRETTDAGRTWHPFASDYSQAAPVPPWLVFADAKVGYATVRGSLQRTIDGGAHWNLLTTPY